MKRILILIVFLAIGHITSQCRLIYAQNTNDILIMLNNIESRLNQIQSQQKIDVNVPKEGRPFKQSVIESEVNQVFTDSLFKSIAVIEAKFADVEKTQQTNYSSFEELQVRIEAIEKGINVINEKTEKLPDNGNIVKLSDELVPELKNLVSELKKTIGSAPKAVIVFKGDFRYRHEIIDEESLDMRNRERIRARISMTAPVSDNVSVEVQFSSGATDDPISTNQDLGGAFSRKPVWIDKAYFAWKPPSLKGLTLSGGKVKNPFYTVNKSQLLWDSDITPEGLTVNYSHIGKNSEIFLNSSGTWVEERKSANDSWLLGCQAGVILTKSLLSITTGTGYYVFTEANGNATFYNNKKSFGNSVDSDGKYTTGFRELEGFLELVSTIKGLPISISGNMVINFGADEENLGYLTGLGIGKCKNRGSWALNYDYRYLEKDALLAVFTESDFNGGGTDGKGHKITFGYQLNKNIQPELSYCLSTRGLDNGAEYNKLTVDFNYKF